MENKYLGRGEAPFSADLWKVLDGVMIEAAKSQLAGRQIVGIEGPFGFGLKVIPLNDCDLGDGVSGSTFVPVNQVSIPFCIGKRDLAAFEMNPVTLDASPVALAAIECARREDMAVFHGVNECPGLMSAEGSAIQSLTKWDKVGTAADQVIGAVTKLDEAGFHGPYCMALAPQLFNTLLRRYPQGDGTELDHIRTIVTDGVVKAPALTKGGVLLASGKQYCSLVIGQDMNLGYNGPDGDTFELFVTESVSLLIRAPEAICVLQ
jgi:uncharacterized linocin/CFP29 family protein